MDTPNYPMRPNHHDFMYEWICEGSYDIFKPGDIVFSTRIQSPWYLKTFLKKGVTLLPKFDMINLWRSKTEQVKRFEGTNIMLPHTKWVNTLHELKLLKSYYDNNVSGEIVTKKQSATSGGRDVKRWENIDRVVEYFNMCPAPKFYPMIIQPLLKNYKDYRVIIFGEYVQAVWRYNPNDWRQNLGLGSTGTYVGLTAEQWKIAKNVQRIANMPYIFMDLMIADSGEIYLCELSLDGVEYLMSHNAVSKMTIELLKRHYKDEVDFS